MVTAIPSSISLRGATEPFELQVNRGLVPFHKIATQSGYNAAAGTSDETVWDGSSLYTYPAAATVMKVSSSSANDTAAGTGARTVYVSGLDSAGAEAVEVVVLNGQTAVSTATVFYRIFSVLVLTAGSGATAAGTIYIGEGTVTAGVPATIYGQIVNDNNRTLMAMFTIPAGYTGYVTSAFASTGGNSGSADYTNISFASRTYGGVFAIGGRSTLQQGSVGTTDIVYSNGIPAWTDIEIRASGSAGTNRVSATFTILYIKNDTQS